MPFHAEYGQDRWLAEGIFRGKRDGVFVEFGALDGLLDSNSLYFEEECGWRGLLAEPNPYLGARLRRNRPKATVLDVAICGVEDCDADFLVVHGAVFGWSGLLSAIEPQHMARIAARDERTERVRVPCASLASVLTGAALRRVDYLSIDVEGAEAAIVAGFPWAGFDIDVVGVEDNFGNAPLDALMARGGYERIARIGVDNFYRRPA